MNGNSNLSCMAVKGLSCVFSFMYKCKLGDEYPICILYNITTSFTPTNRHQKMFNEDGR